MTVGPRLTGADQSERLSATRVPNRQRPAKLIRHKASCESCSLVFMFPPICEIQAKERPPMAATLAHAGRGINQIVSVG